MPTTPAAHRTRCWLRCWARCWAGPRALAARVVVFAVVLAVASCALLGPVGAASADLPAASLTLSARSVSLGTAVTASGTVPTDGRARPVHLEFQTPAGWNALATGSANGSANGTGHYRLVVPTSWLNAFRLRLDAPAVRGLPATVSSVLTLRVRPTVAPLGRSTEHTFLGNARWNPCRVVTWAYNPAGMPRPGLAEFRRAFSMLHAATGLVFRYVGTTDVVPMRDAQDGPYDPRALITVATAPPSLVRDLAGAVIGLGGNLVGLLAGVPQVLQGSVVLDRQQLNGVKPGFGAGPTQGALILHELGHVVGLGHTGGAQEMMYPQLLSYRAARYGAGDLAGLHDLGAAQGCMSAAPVPTAARRTEVTVVHRWVDRG